MGELRVQRLVRLMLAGAVAALVGFAVFGSAPTASDWRSAAFFAAFGFLGHALAYRTSHATSGSIGFLPWLSVALVVPNVLAPSAVFASVFAAETVLRRPFVKTLFNASQHTFAVGVGLTLYLLLGGRSATTGSPSVMAFGVLALAYFALNKLAVSTVIAATTGASTRVLWTRSIKGSLGNDILSVPLVLFFAVAYTRLGAGWSAVLALPTVGLREMYRTVFALQKVNEDLLQLMVASIEARDPYTSGHSQRVARYARLIAQLSGLGERAIDRAATAALLHDVGKIHEEFAVILRKPGRLTDEEFAVMKTHPVRSAELVSRVSQFTDIVSSVRAHHEAWDGTGYPDQLVGESIPLAARIIAFADTIDAMTTSRPYREALGPEQVRVELEKQSGLQFDPRICTELLKPARWQALMAEITLANAEFPATYLFGIDPRDGRTGEYHVRKSSARDSLSN
jgi:hypothetical protein